MISSSSHAFSFGLAKAIASELNAAISPQEQQQLAARPTENLAAYDLYLKSREIANRGAASTREELQKRERLLQSAVELDPKFLDAWCELVQAHVGLIAASVDTTPARLAKATAALERARELAPDVRVNGVSPGANIWPDGESVFDEVARQRILHTVPLRRVGEPDDIARAVRFLLNDAGYVTGQILAVDGGRSINL